MSNKLERVVLSFYDDLLTLFPAHRSDVLRDKKHARPLLVAGDLSLWTVQLPRCHSDFLAALETGSAPPKMDHLGWLLRLCWDAPYTAEAALALLCHRQLSHLLYKLEVPYAPETIQKTLDAFVATERFLEEELDRLLASNTARFGLALARETLIHALPREEVNPLLATERVKVCWGAKPRHGPGAVATGEHGLEKWRFKRLYLSAHQRFPWYDWFVLGKDHLLDRVGWYRGLERLPSPTAKVVLVPKDSRGPRIISEEPLEMQYLQQAYFRMFLKWSRRPLVKGHVFFDNQDVHRAIALRSSKDGDYATLDLKEASDRVSVDLVKHVFPKHIADDLLALRSHRTVLPDGRVVKLRKYAPMGSSTCFPTMAFTVWAVVRAALKWDSELGGLDRSRTDDVFVFGDDVIVPSVAVDSVRLMLSSVGLQVNEKKSFSRSLFRESCGMDAYNGVDITPFRLRRLPGRHSSRDSTFFGLMAGVNNLRRSCLWPTAATSLEELARSAYGDLPRTWDDKQMPGIEVPWPTDLMTRSRWSTSRSRFEVSGVAPYPHRLPDDLDDWEGVYRALVRCTEMPSRYETMRGMVKVKSHWYGYHP